MSRNFTCPHCSTSQKETVVPHDGFGYFVSHRALESMEADLGLACGTLDAWLLGRRRPNEPLKPLLVPASAHCHECGTIAAIDEGGRPLPARPSAAVAPAPASVDLLFYVCNECLAGFREDARATFAALGFVGKDNTCHCGGIYEPKDQETATGFGGALDTALSRMRGNLPS